MIPAGDPKQKIKDIRYIILVVPYNKHATTSCGRPVSFCFLVSFFCVENLSYYSVSKMLVFEIYLGDSSVS